MSEGEPRDPLRDLGDRLAGAQKKTLDDKKPARGGARLDNNALALAWRIGIELVGAVAVASFLGWAFDRWLGTRPWGMILMFFLGVAAGMVNVWRTISGMGMAVGYRRGQQGSQPRNDWDDED